MPPIQFTAELLAEAAWLFARGTTRSQTRWQSRKLLKATTRQWLVYSERMYTETQNPVYVCEAIADARAQQLPLPEWVLDYLERVALSFAELSRNSIPRKGHVDTAVMGALELRHGSFLTKADAIAWAEEERTTIEGGVASS